MSGGKILVDPALAEEASRIGRSLVFGKFLDDSGQSGVQLLTEQEVRKFIS